MLFTLFILLAHGIFKNEIEYVYFQGLTMFWISTVTEIHFFTCPLCPVVSVCEWDVCQLFNINYTEELPDSLMLPMMHKKFPGCASCCSEDVPV